MSFGIQQNDGKGSTSISKSCFNLLFNPSFPNRHPAEKERKKERKLENIHFSEETLVALIRQRGQGTGQSTF